MFNKARLPVAAAMIAILVLSSGCTRIRDHKGYVVDQVLVDSIQPGVDTRESVAQTLGHPSLTGTFDDNSWYYLSRETRQLAFSQPKATDQTLIAVRFDARGNVTGVEKENMDKVVSISPDGGKTPTLGRERGFLRELFGNIGRVGSVGQGGGSTADNPN